MMQQDNTLQLSDGRTLGYAEYGDKSGTPVIYCHGGNGSRIEAQWFADTAHKHHIHLIAPDRPGFGLSDFQPNRTFLDYADGIRQLTDALEISSFSIFGLSGGAPHVLAVTHQMPDRVQQAALISGVTPPNTNNMFKGMWLPVRMIFFSSRWLPALKKILLQQMGKFYADKEVMRKRMLQALPEPDKTLILERPEILDIFALDAQEAHRQGVEGDAWEWHLYVRDWGFALDEITVSFSLWYGTLDANTPPTMGRYYAQTLPNNIYHEVDDGGHFSTINNHIEAIFTYLIS